ncbi:hypothetical protein PRN20_09570 [Devosia sp. ZB163]|uniref:hypothetical protein n=1 Tax=Devosia sp. ZB163 TaxID=3025938 RepID=UPI00236315B9|nr:hypothetical protein [Devosia sp. ZB163]MDC9823984.1 hypothetical protein [Devosia sp. ZB163]
MNNRPEDRAERERELGELAMRNIEWLAFPPTELEARTLPDVLMLPRVVVTRPPRDQLIAAGMVDYDCHRNCAAQEQNDHTGASRHVVGWSPHADDLILHSVVVIDGKWLCLTPQITPVAMHFDFIPDGKLEWREHADGTNRAYRDGQEMPTALRRDPGRHIRMRDQFMELVKAGMSPFDARAAVAKANGAT